MRAVILLVLLVTGACRGRAVEPVERTGVQHAAVAGDTVTLRVGDEVVIGGAGVRLTLRGVFNDSRCPIDVTCVWAGDADVRLEHSRDGGARSTVEVHIHSEPRDVSVHGVRVHLLEIAPPKRSQQQIAPADYTVRLALSAS